MNPRYLFIYSALVLLLANGALGDDGVYQRTKDGKTFIWNNYPTKGETVEWSGDRDKEGYATGQGTATWYKAEGPKFIFSKKHNPVVGGRYTGKMVKGKFEGPVASVNKDGEKIHATFVSGNRTGEWTAGPAPSPSSAKDESVRSTRVTPDQPRNKTPERDAMPNPPALGPTPVARESAKAKVSPPAIETAPPVNNSLRSIAAPPSTLRTNTLGNPSPQASPPPATSSSSTALPQLTTPEVIDLADGEARANGYNPSEYQNPRAQYRATDDTWSVSYDPESASGAREASKHFSVSVEDKTRRTSIAGGK